MYLFNNIKRILIYYNDKYIGNKFHSIELELIHLFIKHEIIWFAKSALFTKILTKLVYIDIINNITII